jgi:hypothetical protein
MIYHIVTKKHGQIMRSFVKPFAFRAGLMSAWVSGLLLFSAAILAEPDTQAPTSSAPASQSAETFRQNLFDVTLILRGEEVSPDSIGPYLETALKIELVRLTGDSGFLSSEQADTFLQSARAWLKQYRFEPYRQDGVTVGQRLIFTFDDDKFYEAFEQKGLVLWPLEARPSTLVYGSQNRAGQLLKLDAQNLQYLPQLDWYNRVEEMALPMTLAATRGQGSFGEGLWVYPDFQRRRSGVVADRLQTSDSDYLLAYQLRQYASQPSELNWQLFSKEGQVMLEAQQQAEDRTPQALTTLFRDMMAAVAAYYSRPYRDQAQYIGSVTLRVEALSSVQQLFQVEQALKALKPVIHDSRLVTTEAGKATFELVYQGTYEALLAYLQGVTSVEMLSDNAISGEIFVRWHQEELTNDLQKLAPQTTDNTRSDEAQGDDLTTEPAVETAPEILPYIDESTPGERE